MAVKHFNQVFPKVIKDLPYIRSDKDRKVSNNCKYQIQTTYLYPARIFKSVVFPAPEGPIIACNCRDLNCPFTFLSISLEPEK